MCPDDSVHISSGATFFQRSCWGGRARQFPSQISEHYKQWSYLSITDTKAASGKGIRAFSAKKTSLPRGICERKVDVKCRMRMPPRLK